MISILTTEAIVFQKPQMKLAPNGQEFLTMQIGLFNIRETGAQEFTFCECTLWSNPNLAKRIIEMDVNVKDRVLITGKLNFKKFRSLLKLRLYIHEFTLLNRAPSLTKNVEQEMEDIDYSFLNDKVEVFETEAIAYTPNEDYIEKETENNEEF